MQVGVASRPIISRSVYLGSWALSGLAVVCDAGIKIADSPPELRKKVAIHQTAFHITASLVVPALIIHQVVEGAQAFIKNRPALAARMHPRMRPIVPVLAALSSIPVVVPVVDHATEWVLERTLEPYLDFKPNFKKH
eukprot:TRINITY_DN8956_c0_g1_i2.p1 TRINITY_DN8956_c0_g1~~TRINITY_DN8956_c0_g1_i2.p1  ORF type:complete len:137 (-),score=29.62 TRINITY_DN8956_c0_g1_i2:18-428(-)